MSETMVAAIFGWVIAGILAVTSYLERRTEQEYKVLLQALEYLTGGSQKRSVGIALIEGLWEKNYPYHRSLLPALINQSVYLLLETEKRDARHQMYNWLRIMDLILRAPCLPELYEHYSEISHALFLHLEPEPLSKGITLTRETAEIWFSRINTHMDAAHEAK